MITKVYRIAEKNIEINSLYSDVHDYCADYLINAIPDFSVNISLDDIAYEQKRADEENLAENKPIIRYSDGYLEELAVYRKIAEKMIDYNTILFHGSVISVDNEGYLFTAKSGTGKSTHTKLWMKYLKEKATMVNDDKPLISINDSAIVYGTPYMGKHLIGNNIHVPLKAICILNRGEKNVIREINPNEAYSMLIQQVYKSRNIERLKMTMELIIKMFKYVKFYSLECNMEIEAAKIAYEGMKK